MIIFVVVLGILVMGSGVVLNRVSAGESVVERWFCEFPMIGCDLEEYGVACTHVFLVGNRESGEGAIKVDDMQVERTEFVADVLERMWRWKKGESESWFEIRHDGGGWYYSLSQGSGKRELRSLFACWRKLE